MRALCTQASFHWEWPYCSGALLTYYCLESKYGVWFDQQPAHLSFCFTTDFRCLVNAPGLTRFWKDVFSACVSQFLSLHSSLGSLSCWTELPLCFLQECHQTAFFLASPHPSALKEMSSLLFIHTLWERLIKFLRDPLEQATCPT